MFWMNVDRVFKKCVVHREECPWVNWITNEVRPEFKGINELRCDGGWFSFTSIEEVENDYMQKWQPTGYILRRDKCVMSDIRVREPKARQLTQPDVQEKALAIAQSLVQIYTRCKLPRYAECFYKPLGYRKSEMEKDPNKIYTMILIAAYDRQPFTRVARGWERIWGTTNEKESLRVILDDLGLLKLGNACKLPLNVIHDLLCKQKFLGYRIDTDGAFTNYAQTIKDISKAVGKYHLLDLMIKATNPQDVKNIFNLLDDIHGIGPTISAKIVMYTLREIGIGHIWPCYLNPAVEPILNEYHNAKLAGELRQKLGEGIISQIYENLKRLGDPFAIDALYYVDRDEPSLRGEVLQLW
jgi:hypothetical protein